ncbi:MAG: mannose-6-phosphate isomerase, class I [Acidimicrobiales bacterium]|nr:mannose-6-phosphate isomerase, class I [Acidimicrobiales bacterium]
MELLEGRLRDYDWGSPTSIPELLGRPASGEPVAELWLGAHPRAPALVGSDHRPLDRVVADDPTAALGSGVEERFGSLPFLLKVLAAAAPLSLQAHPSMEQAEAGYAAEDAAGIPLDAPERAFRDRSHKPELICALTEFDALCGFRDPARTLEVLASIDVAALDTVCTMLSDDPSPAGLARLLEWLLTLDAADAAALTEPVVEACRTDRGEPFSRERAMAVTLGDRYPGDAGVITALLLNFVTLQPGEALFLGSGNLHAYLRGTGVEIMASSDNVLRGGLTSKHVDVAALVEIVEAKPIVPDVQRPPVIDGVAAYAAPVPEFSLQRIEVDGTITVDGGPAILLCTAGRVDAGGHVLDRGAAAWVPASDGPVELSGRATVFRAGVGGL